MLPSDRLKGVIYFRKKSKLLLSPLELLVELLVELVELLLELLVELVESSNFL